MKKIAFLLLLMLAVVNSHAADKSWFKVFKGKIGDYPVTMNVSCFGNDLRGYYYYDKYKKPMDFFGTLKGDSLEIDCYYSYDFSEIFKGILKGNSYSGSWINTENEDKVLNFSVTSSNNSDFEFVYVEGSEKLFKDLETPSASYMEGTVWPSGDFQNAQFVRNSILKLKDLRSGLTEIGDLLLARKKKFIADFRKDNSELKRDDMLDGGWSYSLDLNDVITPVYFDNNFFVISEYTYTYTGGAHGNYGTSFTNLDVKRRKMLSIEDLITSAGIKGLPKLLEKNYKIQNNYPQDKSLMECGLFVDTIPVNGNFAITPGSLMFDYVPYEIASYADGEVKIYIPIEEIRSILKPDYKDLFKE
ncbi:MAG: DUF3298 domain-containing protein [Ignavibacteria bacterium]